MVTTQGKSPVHSVVVYSPLSAAPRSAVRLYIESD